VVSNEWHRFVDLIKPTFPLKIGNSYFNPLTYTELLGELGVQDQ
jgi:hypothetical protein